MVLYSFKFDIIKTYKENGNKWQRVKNGRNQQDTGTLWTKRNMTEVTKPGGKTYKKPA